MKECGYTESYKTILQRFKGSQKAIEGVPVFLQREHLSGDVMEGDFTEVGSLSIGGEQVKVHLWLVRLLLSGCISAVAFYQTTWECFLEGTLQAVESFGVNPFFDLRDHQHGYTLHQDDV